MLKRTLVFLFFLSLSTAAVHADPWNGLNNPANLNPSYQYDFTSLPLEGRVDDAHLPWSDNYWESDWGGISLRWNTLRVEQLDPEGTESLDKYAQFNYSPPTQAQIKAMSKDELKKLSPAEKYDILMGRYDYPTVRAERERTHPSMDDWQGICHGWVPASINHAEPVPTELVGADGTVVPFGSSDIKALLSHYYGVTAYDYARGNRTLRNNNGILEYLDQVDSFDLSRWLAVPQNFTPFVDGYSVEVSRLYPDRTYKGVIEALNLVSQIGQRPEKRDLFGVKGIKDPNAGAFHVVMANQLGLLKRSIVGNINKKLRNGEIWNQPLVGYSTQILKDKLKKHGQSTVDVRTKLVYVSEIAQRWEPVINTPVQRYAEMEFEYQLELQDGRIVGGKWEKRAQHPSFLWKHNRLPIQGYFSRLNEMSQGRD
jgi:hypothetical protein